MWDRLARCVILALVAFVLVFSRTFSKPDTIVIHPFKLPALSNTTFQPDTASTPPLSFPIWTSTRPPSLEEILQRVEGYSNKITIYNPHPSFIGSLTHTTKIK
jgi:hypothetical protein